MSSDYHFMAGSKMSYSDIVHAWLAFRELEADGIVGIAFCHDARDVNAADRAGWNLGPWKKTRERRYLERMRATPFGFFRGFEWGIDIYRRGDAPSGQIHPEKLCELQRVHRAKSGMGPLEVESNQLHEYIRGLGSDFREERSGKASQKSVPSRTLQISPFWLRSPIAALRREYGIAEGKIYDRPTLAGVISLGPGPSVDVDAVKRVHARGNHLWGDVVFADETGDVVTWSQVFLPERVKAEAEKVISETRARTVPVDTGVAREEKACPFCAERILVQARYCKHCHQSLVESTNR
jgi:hypothetical protein